jgi:hypothetical protein
MIFLTYSGKGKSSLNYEKKTESRCIQNAQNKMEYQKLKRKTKHGRNCSVIEALINICVYIPLIDSWALESPTPTLSHAIC